MTFHEKLQVRKLREDAFLRGDRQAFDAYEEILHAQETPDVEVLHRPGDPPNVGRSEPEDEHAHPEQVVRVDARALETARRVINAHHQLIVDALKELGLSPWGAQDVCHALHKIVDDDYRGPR